MAAQGLSPPSSLPAPHAPLVLPLSSHWLHRWPRCSSQPRRPAAAPAAPGMAAPASSRTRRRGQTTATPSTGAPPPAAASCRRPRAWAWSCRRAAASCGSRQAARGGSGGWPGRRRRRCAVCRRSAACWRLPHLPCAALSPLPPVPSPVPTTGAHRAGHRLPCGPHRKRAPRPLHRRRPPHVDGAPGAPLALCVCWHAGRALLAGRPAGGSA